jgi:hypothetical protein
MSGPQNGEEQPVARATEHGQTLPDGIKYEIWHKMPDGQYHHLAASIRDGITRYYTNGKLDAEAIEAYNEKGYMVSS